MRSLLQSGAQIVPVPGKTVLERDPPGNETAGSQFFKNRWIMEGSSGGGKVPSSVDQRVLKVKKHRNSHAREVAMQALYQIEVVNHPVAHVLRFTWLNEPMPAAVHEHCVDLIQGVTDNWEALDRMIQSVSHKDITQISIINRCILRIGILELMQAKLDPGIVIDDLLNLTRQYDGEESVGFVNGILDRFEQERRQKYRSSDPNRESSVDE